MNVIVMAGGENYDEVHMDGERLHPTHSQRVWNHSPDGFSWGYAGSGPAQLALAILLKAGVDEEFAVRYHQQFKFEHLVKVPRAGGTIELDVLLWVAEQEEKLARAGAL